jgi:CHAT domain-containing protein
MARQKRSGRQRPRLFLCPTGMFSFLPIHAAGMYGPNDEAHCLSDYCVTSYTPTLGALLSSQHHSTTVSRDHINFLLAAAPKPFKLNALPAVQDEADAVSTIVPPRCLMSLGHADECTHHSVSTANDVLRLLPDATILHLACHGQQNVEKPLKSGFIMHDKMIRVEDLVRLNLPNAHLAFLSACETAQGDLERPDEALHLAATMLYAGFKSVVGTMWSMGDVDGPIVAQTVYEELFAGDASMLDFDIVPYALDAAVRTLRSQGLEPSRWAPYIHLGM